VSRKHFGTDGIRGTVGKAPITPDFVLRLGHAVGRVLRRTQKRATVLIGKDTRSWRPVSPRPVSTCC
jgi:phosphoglucosamine mutase